MNRQLLLALSLLALGIFSPPAEAQEVDLTAPRFAFSPEVTYSDAIPSPAEHLGYELGEHFTLYADVVSYLETLAEASNRVTLHRYGETYEGRPLHYLVITSTDNHERIEEIRENNLRLADPNALSSTEAEELVAQQPAILWLSYNIHGNEPSSTETAMQVAYRLAAGQDEATRRILDESVVIIDPCLNPDGRDRYVYWYKSARNAQLNTSPEDLEHDEPWPGGRTNHYWFDLNRDWLWLVHPESRGRVAAYQEWLPQMHVDYHEQSFNSNYFTMPGDTPRNPLLPDAYRTWAERYGQANVDAFDEHGISYFTREAFDFFYPGYGSSYPSTLGAIGMLTEQGGGRRGGRAVETEDGYVLTFRQRIFDHYTTSIAALETSIENREELLRYFRDFFTQEANEGEAAAYLLRDDEGNGYVYDVVDLLLKHGIAVERLQEEATLPARDYWDDAAEEYSFEEGTFVVRTDQPRHVFINSVMQRQVAFEDSVMYDMASWSAPLAYNLDAYWTEAPPRPQTRPLAEAPAPPSGVVNPNARYAYVIDWRQRHAPKALAKLWQKGYRVRTAYRPFTIEGRDFSCGSLIVLLGRNRELLDQAPADMARIAEEAGVQVVGLNTGRSRDGMDLASRDSEPAEAPNIALMVDSPFSAYTAGQIWHLFDQGIEQPISRIRASAFDNIDLEDYDVLIFPGAWGGLSDDIDSAQVERLKGWVERGGTLVATESSAGFFTKEASGLTDVEVVEEEEADTTGKPSYYTPYEAREDSTGLERVPGSAFRGHLDTTHPLAFGMPERVYSLKLDTEALEPSDRLQTVGYYDSSPDEVMAAGYASRDNRERLAKEAFAAVQPMGGGQVVFLIDNTQYRMFWVGPARLMTNAAMLVPSM